MQATFCHLIMAVVFWVSRTPPSLIDGVPDLAKQVPKCRLLPGAEPPASS